MKCSLGISNFLEEISSLSLSVVFLYFFALIAEKGFLVFLLFSGTLHSDAFIFPFLLCFPLLFCSRFQEQMNGKDRANFEADIPSLFPPFWLYLSSCLQF